VVVVGPVATVVTVTAPTGAVVTGVTAGGTVPEDDDAMLVVVAAGTLVDTEVVVGVTVDVVVGATVVVVVVVVVVEVVAGGDVAGTEVGVMLPVHGNGVPQLKTVEFTFVTVRPTGPESVSSPAASVARRSSFVLATGVMGPEGVKAAV
jgi:hypothetical protein